MSKYNDVGRAGITYALDYTGTPASVATAFSAQTYTIRIAATSAMHYRIYDASVWSVVTSADPFLPTGVVSIVGVTPGQHISAIMANYQYGSSTTASVAGRLTVTELS